MATIIVLVVLALVATLLVLASRKPDSFRVERSAHVAATPESIFPLIDDFRNWTRWSPWEKLDPALKREYLGNPRGAGSVYTWEGNRQAGAGRMEIVEAIPPSRVVIRLQFTRPFRSTNTTDFAILPESGGSRVTWATFGPQAFGQKVMCVFIDMDRLMGKDFEEGLRNLKRVAESERAGTAEPPVTA